MLKETLREILKTQELPPHATGEIERALLSDLSPHPGFATVLTGVRRCGKSTLQAQLARQSGRAFYCNFEDTRLFEMTAADFPLWLDLLDELAPAPVFTKYRKLKAGSGLREHCSTVGGFCA